MIYKKFEISQSLNGEKIISIARNYAGIVIFRAETIDEVKVMIDKSIEEQERIEKEAEEKRLKKEAEKEKRKKRGLFQPPVEEEAQIEDQQVENNEASEEPAGTSVLVPPHQRVTRGPDGKFISKSQLQAMDEEKKKTFWEKLTS